MINDPNRFETRLPPVRLWLFRLRRRALLPLGLAIAAVVSAFHWQTITPVDHRPKPVVLNGGNALDGIKRTTGRKPVERVIGAEVTGRVSHVRDGDTIEVGHTAVRIANLDCPERGQPGAARATARMKQLSRNGRVSCALTGKRSYDRRVGTCRTSQGQDIGAILIREGLCRRWR